MALPVVSYGTYNYGDYASPKAVQYKGGLGEGLTTAILGVQKAKQERRAEIKQALEDSLLLSSQFSNQLNQLFGKASAYNKKFLQDLKVDFGNNVKNYKLGKITFEEYEENVAYFNGVLNDASLLSSVMQPVIESDTDIKFQEARSDDDNQASVLTRWGIRNGKYLLDRDENGLKVVVAHGTPNNFSPKGISASELINNPAYITPELKYDNNKNENYKNAVASLKQVLLLKPDLLNREDYEDTKQSLFNLDPSKQSQILAEIANQDGIENILDNETDRKAYYEDIMLNEKGEPNGLGTYKGTAEQIEMIKGSLAADLYQTLIKNPIGSQAYAPPGDDLTYAQRVALGKQNDYEEQVNTALEKLKAITDPKVTVGARNPMGITPEMDLTTTYRGLDISTGTSIDKIKEITKVYRDTENELIVDIKTGTGSTGATGILKRINLRDPRIISSILPSAATRDYPKIAKDIITRYNIDPSDPTYKGINISN